MKKLFLIFFFALFNYNLCFDNIRKLVIKENINVTSIKFKYNKLIIKGNYTETSLENETSVTLNFENLENSTIVNQTLSCKLYNESIITYNIECGVTKNISSNFNGSTINNLLNNNIISLGLYIKDAQNLTYNHNTTRLLTFGNFNTTNDNSTNVTAYFIKPKNFTGKNNLFFNAKINYTNNSFETRLLTGIETNKNIDDTLVYNIYFEHMNQQIVSLISLQDYCITDNERDNITYFNGVIYDNNNFNMLKKETIIIFNNSKIISKSPLTIQGNYPNELSLKSDNNDDLLELSYYENETLNNISCTIGINKNDKTYTIYCVLDKSIHANLLGTKANVTDILKTQSLRNLEEQNTENTFIVINGEENNLNVNFEPKTNYTDKKLGGGYVVLIVLGSIAAIIGVVAAAFFLNRDRILPPKEIEVVNSTSNINKQ